MQKLLCEMAMAEDGHKRELEAVRERSRKEAELAQREAVNQSESSQLKTRINNRI